MIQETYPSSKIIPMYPTKKQAVHNTYFRLGLHAKSKAIVEALAKQGVQVDEKLVRQVRIELLKETTDEKPSKFSRAVCPPVVRRPQGFQNNSKRGIQ